MHQLEPGLESEHFAGPELKPTAREVGLNDRVRTDGGDDPLAVVGGYFFDPRSVLGKEQVGCHLRDGGLVLSS